MVYEVPKSKASIAQNRFEFKVPSDRKTYSIPLLKFIRPATAVEIEPLSWREAVEAIYADSYAGESLLAKFDEGEQFEAWLAAYQEASGITLGESKASSDS